MFASPEVHAATIVQNSQELAMIYGAIRFILLTVILLPASWAAFGAVSGTSICVLLFASAAYFLVSGSRWTRSIRIAAIWLGLAALIGLLVPAVQAAREA